jgi:hypothetical protein
MKQNNYKNSTMNSIVHIKNIETYDKHKFRLEICNNEIRLYQNELEKTPTDNIKWREHLERRIQKKIKVKNQMLFGRSLDLEDLKY